MGRFLKFVSLLVLLASCGTTESGTSGKSNQTDVVVVAKDLVTAFVKLDLETVRSLLVPEDQPAVENLKWAAELGGASPPEKVNVTAVLVESDGNTATVDISGSYCLPASKNIVTETTVEFGTSEDGVGDDATPETVVVEEPERCFDLDEIFDLNDMEFKSIDGKWFGHLPS